ncbi:hypothetical protein [Actinophytocola sp.]|uniref:hypothetical protein n=1 Tax=Actinophytocola sp. TaxID=1872138 RepID=UPI00389AA90E
MALVVGVLSLMSVSLAGAAPKDVGEIPAPLQKYLPGSPGWDSSPWMTSPACRDKGGDFSAWAAAVIVDTPELLKVFNADIFGPDAPKEGKARSDAILAGYQQLATDLQGQIPAGYCVDDVKRWAGEDPKMRPFGFAWGMVDTTIFSCTDTEPGVKESEYRNKWVGAERAPCDGFSVSCKHAGADQKRCDAWNEFSADYTDRVYTLRATAINDHPASQQGEVDTRIKSPEELAGDIADSAFGKLATAIAKGAATFLAEAMTFWTRTDRSSMLKSPAIKSIQDSLWYVAVVLLVGSVMWQGILLLFKRKPDPLVNAGMGLLSFIGWSTLGGTVAVVLYEAGLALTTQVLDESIDKFATAMGTAMMANVVVSAPIIFFLAIILFLLACIQWFLGFFRMGALVILLALIPLAAAGQINESTKPWLPKVAGWSLALICYQPVSGLVFAIGFTLIGDGTDISTVLTGMATLGLAVMSMPTLHRFFDWGGRSFASGGGGGGGPMVVGAAASALGGSFAQYMDRSGPGGRGGGGGQAGGGGGPGGGAPPVAGANFGDVPGGGPGSGGNGAPGGGGPRPQAGGVVPAVSGTPHGSPTTAAAGGTAATSATSGAAGSSTAAGASGVSAAGAGPAGAAVAAAHMARDRAAGAMTDGAPPPGGDRNG